MESLITLGIVLGAAAVMLSPVLTPLAWSFSKEFLLPEKKSPELLEENRKQEQRRKDLDMKFSSFTDSAKFLLDGKHYQHTCKIQKCGGDSYYYHDKGFAKAFAKEDFTNHVESESGKEMVKQGKFNELLDKVDLLEPERIKEFYNRNLIDVPELTDEEWELVHEEYNNHLIYLFNKDSELHAILNTHREDNKNKLKKALLEGDEKQRLSAMSAEDMKRQSWEDRFSAVE